MSCLVDAGQAASLCLPVQSRGRGSDQATTVKHSAQVGHMAGAVPSSLAGAWGEHRCQHPSVRHKLLETSPSPCSLRTLPPSTPGPGCRLYSQPVSDSFSFLVNSLADKVMSFLLPTLPTLVKSQLCPVIEAAFEDMREDLLRLVRVPISLSSGHLQFDLLSPAIKHDVIQLHLQAELSDSQGKVTKWFNESAVSLTMPTPEGEPFSLTIRQDVVNAAVATLVPPEELMVLLDYVLPELALRLKSSIKVINEKAADQLGPTQIVKIVTQETPELLLDQGRAKVAQLIVLEVFATSEVRRPFFTLGIEASSEAQFYTKGDQLTLNLNEISANRIHLMNSGIGLFDPELLKDITAEMLTSALLPNENGKLSSGIPVSMVKALGFEAASCSLTNDALVVTPASS
nr:BPI fold-containing family B member 1-like isoform X2 [Equus asinus]